jgi:hypothetical protein
MLDPAETADMAVDRYIVGRIREDHPCLFAIEQFDVSGLVAGEAGETLVPTSEKGKRKYIPASIAVEKRFLIELSEYTTLERAAVWKEGRNPVSYKTLKALSIDLRGLKLR